MVYVQTAKTIVCGGPTSTSSPRLTMPGPGNCVTTSAPSKPQKVQVAPVVSMWLMLRTLSGQTLVLSSYRCLILRKTYWCIPATYRRVWGWYTLLLQLQSRLHSRWASNSWGSGSRTSMHRHMLPGEYCTASSRRCMVYSVQACGRRSRRRLERGFERLKD
jgi:hypothetical protein